VALTRKVVINGIGFGR